MNNDIFFAVIDLGSSEIRGVVASKLDNGRVAPVASYALAAENAVRCGCIYNINSTAEKISQIVKKLNEYLPDNVEIKKLYVGVGGQSLRSHEFSFSLDLASSEAEEISQDHLDQLQHEAEQVQIEGRDILHIARPQYFVNGKLEKYPKGIPCNRFEAHYQIITARTMVLRNIRTVVEDRLHLKLQEVLVSPMCEADVTLLDEEKTLGVAYVNIGAGCTSVTIYKRDLLMLLRVLPMGGGNITQDLTSLRLLPIDAERVKKEYATLKYDAERNTSLKLQLGDGLSERTIRLLEVYRLVHARMKEITANYLSIVDRFDAENRLGSGIVIAGGGALLDEYEPMMKKERQFIRFAEIRPDMVEENAISYNPTFRTCMGLLYAATENCAGLIHDNLGGLYQNVPTTQSSASGAIVGTLNFGDSESVSSGSVITAVHDDDEEIPAFSSGSSVSRPISRKKNKWEREQNTETKEKNKNESWLTRKFKGLTASLGENFDEEDDNE